MRMMMKENYGIDRLADGFVMIVFPDTNNSDGLVECGNDRRVNGVSRSWIAESKSGGFIDDTTCWWFFLVKISAGHECHSKSIFISFVDPHDPEGLLFLIFCAD